MNFGGGIARNENKLQEIKENGVTTGRVLGRKGLRRSKSCSDFGKITKLPISRLPMPTLQANKSRPKSPIHVKPQLGAIKKDLAPPTITSSISMTNLSTHGAASHKVKPKNQPSNMAIEKKAEKRPHTATRPPLAKRTKPEQANQATNKTGSDKVAAEKTVARTKKPPSYDYKARFNILDAKHQSLREAHNTIKQEKDKLKAENERLSAESVAMQIEVGRLKVVEASAKELNKEYATLQTNNKILAEKFHHLNEEHTDLTEKYNTLHDAHVMCGETIKQMTQKLEDLKLAFANIENELEHCKIELQSSEDTRKSLHDTVQNMKGNIRVFCRVRPQLPNETHKIVSSINYIDESTLELKGKDNSKSEFTFNKVFPPQATQCEIFEDLSQLVQSALDGYNVCVFAYGQTGSGKTYTMLGQELDSDADPFKLTGESNELPSSAGMIPRSIHLLFNKIKKLEKLGWTFTLQASFLEIYNETLRDLLDQGSKHLDIKYNEGKGVIVTNLSIQTIQTFDDFKQHMVASQKNRAVATTNYNEHSSRSHAVTKIYIHGVNESFNITHNASINLIDLAGSENAKTSTGDRLTETKNINKSLSALGTVMLALQKKDDHVPYRNSKLTYLLQSCLGGNCKTLMVVNISPIEDWFHETTSSLRFAASLKEIKLNLRKNKGYLSREAL